MLQSTHHHQKTNTQLLQAGCPSCHLTNNVKALKWKYHIPWTCLPQAHLEVFQLCLWPPIAPGYLGGGLQCLLSALWCQYPEGSLSYCPVHNPNGYMQDHPGISHISVFFAILQDSPVFFTNYRTVLHTSIWIICSMVLHFGVFLLFTGHSSI